MGDYQDEGGVISRNIKHIINPSNRWDKADSAEEIEFRANWNEIQKTLFCCGVDGYEDVLLHDHDQGYNELKSDGCIPRSCCVQEDECNPEV